VKTQMDTGKSEQGVALIAALIILLVITIIGISGMDETVLEEKMVTNFKDRAMAANAAEATLRSAENWLGRLLEKPDEQTAAGCANPPLCGETGYVIWDENQALTGGQTVASLSWNDWQTLGVEYQGSGTVNSSLGYAHAQPRALVEFRSFNPQNSLGTVYQMNPDLASAGVGPYYYNVSGAGVGYRPESMSVMETTFRKWF
jgi:type IV pilus assembly protein PilX